MNDLSKLIARYTDDDLPSAAMEVLSAQNYELMMKFKDGVPSGVMFTANTTTVERTLKMMAGMLMDLGGQVYGWTDEEKTKQESLTNVYIDLIAAESLNMVLKATAPEEETDENPG